MASEVAALGPVREAEAQVRQHQEGLREDPGRADRTAQFVDAVQLQILQYGGPESEEELLQV